MSKVVINNTAHAIQVGGVFLIPGTNIVDSIDAKLASDMVESGKLTVNDSEKMDEAQKKNAVEKSNTKSTLDKLDGMFKGVDTKKRKKELDEFDADIANAEKEKESK